MRVGSAKRTVSPFVRIDENRSWVRKEKETRFVKEDVNGNNGGYIRKINKTQEKKGMILYIQLKDVTKRGEKKTMNRKRMTASFDKMCETRM